MYIKRVLYPAMAELIYLVAFLMMVAGTLAGGLVGFTLGTLWAIATFLESVWSPPSLLMLEVPPGFARAEVILIGDLSAPTELHWIGGQLPFT